MKPAAPDPKPALIGDGPRAVDLAQRLAEVLMEALDGASEADIEIPVRLFGGGRIAVVRVRLGG